MVETNAVRSITSEVNPDRGAYVTACRWMLLARLLDEKFANLYRGGKIHGGVYLSKGQEALSVAIGVCLKKGDVFSPLIRDAAGRLAFGESVLDAVRTYLGSPLGPMKARDGNVHRGRPREGLLPMLSHLGAMISVVNGVLLARRMKGLAGSVGVASIGDGATSTGAFHEGINQAAVENLPLVLVIANNQYAYSTPTSRQFACRNLVDKAVGYGVKGYTVDGTDLMTCLKVVGAAINQAREGGGPQMVVAHLLRLCGHGEHDDASYVLPELKQSPMGNDCLNIAEAFMIKQNWLDAKTLEDWRQEAHRQVEETVLLVQRELPPDANQEEWRALATERLFESAGH